MQQIQTTKECRLVLPPVGRPIEAGHLKLGGQDPYGNTIGVTNSYVTWNGGPRFLISGEFHFSRYPASEWAHELRKIAAGGINLVATYVFWIHHEVVEGNYDWMGDKDLRRFVMLCGEAGLQVLVRIGPFAHGECRNGGLPDWLYGQPFAVRSNDPRYLEHVQRFYAAIGRQLAGLCFKDGGPIVGVQLENEYMHTGAPWETGYPSAPAEWVPAGADGPEHLRRLKALALAAGLDVPIYTATAWGGAPILEDETLPVYGDYAYPVWIDEPEPSRAYLFGDRHALPVPEPTHRVPYRYPLAMAELQGGIQIRYANRPVVPARSTEAMALVCVGNGSNWVGYYMYHGGTNPRGPAGFTNERLHPQLSYDFQAPLGEYGQVRDSYRYLKVLHLFLQAYGAQLAPMPTLLPHDAATVQPADTHRVRWCVRARGGSGFLFFNNFQDHVDTKAQPDVRFVVEHADGSSNFPTDATLTIPPDFCGILPFGLEMQGVYLRSATVQPLTILATDGSAHYFFFALPGIDAEYCFAADTIARIDGQGARVDTTPAGRRVMVTPGIASTFALETTSGKKLQVTTLTRAEAEQSWRGVAWGAERLIVTPADVTYVDGGVELHVQGSPSVQLQVFPPLVVDLSSQEGRITVVPGARFTGLILEAPPCIASFDVEPCGPGRYLLTFAPELWRTAGNLYLHIDYAGDTGMAFIDGRLIADNFCNGTPWTIGLQRFAAELADHKLCLVFRPLHQGTVKNVSTNLAARFAFEGEEKLAVHSLELLPEYTFNLKIRSTL